MQTIEQLRDLGLELEGGDRLVAAADEHGGDERNRDHRHDAPDRLHEVRAERGHLAPAILAREAVEVEAARPAVLAHGDRLV